jgi:hypothetical protein
LLHIFFFFVWELFLRKVMNFDLGMENADEHYKCVAFLSCLFRFWIKIVFSNMLFHNDIYISGGNFCWYCQFCQFSGFEVRLAVFFIPFRQMNLEVGHDTLSHALDKTLLNINETAYLFYRPL